MEAGTGRAKTPNTILCCASRREEAFCCRRPKTSLAKMSEFARLSETWLKKQKNKKKKNSLL